MEWGHYSTFGTFALFQDYIYMLFRRNIKIGIQVHLLYLVDLCSAQPTYLGMQPPISDVILPVLRVPVVQVYVVLVICYPEI